MNKLKKGLRLIGLTELEAKIYLKLLKLGEVKVSELAKKTKVTRTQLYPLLEKLVEKGVVEKLEDKPIIRYKVLDPDKLILLLERWKKQQINILKALELSLKKLKKK
jgi:sugar-specific transcriptional regulator TrmB